MASLALHTLYKKYPNATEYAVNDFSFSCESGEFIAILGPSGCGKTTTLRMIAGLESVSKGRISLDGEDIHHLDPKDRGIGLAFEDYALYPPLTVYDNIAFNLRAKKETPSVVKKRVEEIAELLHVKDILRAYPSELSGGQKQRVNIARAIVRRPKLLLLDEPMSHLDGKLRQVLRMEIRKLHKEMQCTTILVTHDQLEAMSLADRLVIMDHGRLQQYTSPAVTYNNPVNKFVADFIGDPPMNIVDACVVRQKKGYVIRFYDIEVAISQETAEKVTEGAPICFGIRPDDVLISPEGSPVRVSVFENLGEEKRISIRLGEELYFMISTLQEVKYGSGETIRIAFKEDRIHFFDMTSSLHL